MIPQGLEDNIVFQTGIFVKTFQSKMEEAFKKAGVNVTAEQFTILTQLWYQDGLSQKSIAVAVERDKTTISRVIKNMIKQNLVTHVPGIDKRERLIYLTQYGRSVQLQLVKISGSFYMKAINDISENVLLRTIKTLVKMTTNLT
jgi:DNA-binding MarR family transcriptional regulator